jgi:hypothetical protein
VEEILWEIVSLKCGKLLGFFGFLSVFWVSGFPIISLRILGKISIVIFVELFGAFQFCELFIICKAFKI